MIKIIYAMINQVMPEDFEDNLYFSEGDYEIMLFDTDILIEVDGQMREYPRYTTILYEPGQHVHYHAKSGELVYSWIRFTCDEPLFTKGYVPLGIPVFCSDYSWFLQYFQQVANENFWNRPSSSYILEDLMHIIFHKLHDYAFPPDYSRYQSGLMQLRSEIYAHPEYDWTLEMMSSRLNLSIRAMQKAYKEFAHITCINDVIESRITYAKTLLMRTGQSIQDISIACGYKNVEHFCRQFKSHEGMTPNKYRKSHLAEETNSQAHK